jgi:tetratricopeptide (TPR) repeat protein
VGWVPVAAAMRARARRDPSPVAAVRLARSEWNAVLVREGNTLTDPRGQLLLPLPTDPQDDADALFEAAQLAEESTDWQRAASLYRRCLALEPRDPVIAFNLSHALLQAGELAEARRSLHQVLRLDPAYAEAWYNLAAIAREEKQPAVARRHLHEAMSLDPLYPDPVYNLALLEYEGGNYDEATRLWTRYLELDPGSDWSRRARQGLQLIGMLRQHGGAPVTPPTAPPPQGLRVVG